MGFYELGNGCDSCDTISSAVPNNVNMQMDQNSGLLANMAYGAQANNNMPSSGYTQQGNNMGNNMGNGSTTSTMGVPRQQQQPTQAPQTQPKQVVKQVVTTTTTAQPSASAPSASASQNKVEGFTNDMSENVINNDKKWIVLGLVIFSALASNECCKYFLNKSLQLNDGSPMYYVAYVGVAVLLTMAANKYASTA